MSKKNYLSKERVSAFLVHLFLSILVAIFSIILVFRIWYPTPLHIALGVTDMYYIILAVDIILGPLLTLILFKKNKKGMWFDLIVIAILQLSALLYGLYTVYKGKPNWIVFNVDRFDLIRANDVEPNSLNTKYTQFNSHNYFKYKYAGVTIPKDNIELSNKILDEELQSGYFLPQKPKYYLPLEQVKSEMTNKAITLKNLNKFNKQKIIESILSAYPQADSYLPLATKNIDMTILINKKDAKIIDIVDLRPW